MSDKPNRIKKLVRSYLFEFPKNKEDEELENLFFLFIGRYGIINAARYIDFIRSDLCTNDQNLFKETLKETFRLLTFELREQEEENENDQRLSTNQQ